MRHLEQIISGESRVFATNENEFGQVGTRQITLPQKPHLYQSLFRLHKRGDLRFPSECTFTNIFITQERTLRCAFSARVQDFFLFFTY